MKSTVLGNKMIIRFYCSLILFFSAFHQFRAQEACFKLNDRERAWSYDESQPFGPANWTKLWPTCGGNLQSPIDLGNPSVQVGPNPVQILKFQQPQIYNAQITNIYHYTKINWIDKPDRFIIDGIRYRIGGFRFHSPSEHAINGKRSDLEMQIYLSDGKVRDAAGIAILYKIGQPDKFLSLIEDDLRGLANKTTTSSKPVSLDQSGPLLKIKSVINYYRYMGSDTAPPCCQAIPWLVAQQVQTVSSNQVQLIRQASHSPLGGSARPVQPVNGRQVKLYNKK